MIKITHPHAHVGKAWTCVGCDDLVVDASVCGSCYAVFCPTCAAMPSHLIPTGERKGLPCPAVEAQAQAA